jgi:hypothetical protein
LSTILTFLRSLRLLATQQSPPITSLPVAERGNVARTRTLKLRRVIQAARRLLAGRGAAGKQQKEETEPTDTVLFFPQGFNEAVGSIEQQKPQNPHSTSKMVYNRPEMRLNTKFGLSGPQSGNSTPRMAIYSAEEDA